MAMINIMIRMPKELKSVNEKRLKKPLERLEGETGDLVREKTLNELADKIKKGQL